MPTQAVYATSAAATVTGPSCLRSLRSAERLVECLAQQRSIMRAHLQREMRERRAPVRAGAQRLVHQRCGVSGTGPGGLVAPRPAVPLPPQPPLAMQVLHHRHDRGVSERPVVMQIVNHLADQRRPAPLPQPVHDHSFQLTQLTHLRLPDMPAVRSYPPLPTITDRTSRWFTQQADSQSGRGHETAGLSPGHGWLVSFQAMHAGHEPWPGSRATCCSAPTGPCGCGWSPCKHTPPRTSATTPGPASVVAPRASRA